MKRFLAISFLLLSVFLSSAAELDKDGHALVSLWKNYYSASDDDKPQDQLAALAIISTQAKEKSMAWDLYDACQKTYEVKCRMNFRKSREYANERNRTLADSGIEAITFLLYKTSGKDALAYANDCRKQMSARYCRTLWSHVIADSELKPAVIESVTNDYDAALWCLYLGDSNLKSAELLRLRYGNVISLLDSQNRLRDRFDSLRTAPGVKEKDFIALKNDCLALNEKRNTFSGDEKKIGLMSTGADSIVKELESIGFEGYVKDGKIVVVVRNAPEVKLRILSGKKTLFEKTLKNGACRFFMGDTLACVFPLIDDGVYNLEMSYGKALENVEISNYTLSIAQRYDSQGFAVFITDSRTGKPVRNCTVSGIQTDCSKGFFYIPLESPTQIQAESRDESGRLQKSRPVYSHPLKVKSDVGQPAKKYCKILTDRAAFKPGETVGFKAIVYEDNNGLKPCRNGIFRITVSDPDNREVYSKKLQTNGFGSVSGSYTFQKESKGGLYSISVRSENDILGSHYVRMDEFVLPSFNLEWAEDNRMWFSGDTLCVEGTVRSYSGHSISSVKAEYTAEAPCSGNAVPVHGKLDMDSEGRFKISFPTEKGAGDAIVRVTITDSTGESLEFSTFKLLYNSLPLDISLLNGEKGNVLLENPYAQAGILDSDIARFSVSLGGMKQPVQCPGVKISYQLLFGEFVAASGVVPEDGNFSLDMRGLRSGKYRLVVSAEAKDQNGNTFVEEKGFILVRSSIKDNALFCDAIAYFREIDGNEAAVQIGTTAGPSWFVLDLYNGNGVHLATRMVEMYGKRGEPGSLQTVSFGKRPDGPVTLAVTSFIDGRAVNYIREWKDDPGMVELPVSFSRFTDVSRPSSDYTLEFNAPAGSECAATVYDAATDRVQSNEWDRIHSLARGNESRPIYYLYSGVSEYGYADSYMLTKSLKVAGLADNAMETVRSDFHPSLAWAPMLYPDGNGHAGITFSTSDNLSTYNVQLFVHDVNMNSGVLSRSFKVTVPIKVSVMEPQYLYEGDIYEAGVTLANSMEKDVPGIVSVRFYNGTDYLNSQLVHTGSSRVVIPASGAASYSFAAPVPDGVSNLGILVKFVADDRSAGSDAVFVTSKVLPASQNLIEAHSAVLAGGSDKKALEAELRAKFINANPDSAKVSLISIRKMLADAVPSTIDPDSESSKSIADAILSRSIMSELGLPPTSSVKTDVELVKSLSSCQNRDGGFGWFPGMKSSPRITAYILESIAELPDATDGIDVKAAVNYLDSSCFDDSRASWNGALPLDIYLYARTMYLSVPFDISNANAGELAAFRKKVSAFMVPSGSRSLEGGVPSKLRRILSARAIISSADGLSLAESLGLGKKVRKLSQSQMKDIESVKQYSSNHKDGGIYFPSLDSANGGLLESSLHLHSLMCRLFDGIAGDSPDAVAMSDGIRLWIMLQKETQKWNPDPSFCEALDCVFHGSDKLLSTQVVSLSAPYSKPFSQIEAAGNGMSVECHYYSAGKEVAPGTPIHVGDRITARYHLTSDRTRSFVRIVASRPACLRPVNQLSGPFGWWLQPLRSNSFSYVPQGYREVRYDRTMFWFDCWPEGEVDLEEEFFVVRAGRFASPADEIECLYSPHYRANDAGGRVMVAED